MPAPLPSLAGSIVLKAVADLPARLFGGNAQQVEVTGLDYTLHLDIEKLPEAETTTTHDQWTPVWDEAKDIYERVNLNNVLLEVAAEAAGGVSKVFDTKAVAEAATMPAAAKTLLLNGYATVGDAQQTMICKRVNAMPTAHVGWVRTLDRYKADGTTDATDGGYWEYVYPAEGVRIEWYGGKADDVTDNSIAFHKAMKIIEIENAGAGYPFYKGGPKILFGSLLGTSAIADQVNIQPYHFASTLIPDRSVHICGPHSGNVHGNAGRAARLVFPQGIKGIHIKGHSPEPTVPGAFDTTIENLNIMVQPGRVTGHPFISGENGIEAATRLKMINCSVSGFGGHGVQVFADITGGGGNNANLFYLELVESGGNGGHGFYLNGGDANAGTILSCSAEGNTGWGFYDNAFLGNTFIACHTAGNVGGPYYGVGVNGPSVFIGCYAEGDQPGSYAGSGVTFIGGLLASGVVTSGTGHHQYGGTHKGPMTFASSDVDTSCSYAIRPSGKTLWSMADNSGNAHMFHFDPGNAFFGLAFLGIDTEIAYGITASAGSPLRTPNIPRNRFLLPFGTYIGGETSGLGNMRLLQFEAEQPAVAGTSYLQGDIAFDRQTRKAGWVCTTAGVGAAAIWARFGDFILDGNIVWDAPSIANGASSAVQNITVTGARGGDFAQVTARDNLQGLIINAWIPANDTVSFQLHNFTGGAVDLGNNTYNARVRKA